MKHFNLLKTLLLLCALIVGSLSSWADDYELVTSAPTDWTGDYVLVNECSASASTFLTDGTVSGNSFSTASAVKTLSQAGITYNSTTKKLTDVTDAYVLHVAPSSTSGKYNITLKGATTTIYLIANSNTGSSSISTATVTTNADWSISLGNNGNAYLVGKSGRYVGWNSTYFRAYASSNKDTYKCYLFRKSAASANSDPSLSLNKNSLAFGEVTATGNKSMTFTVTPANLKNGLTIVSSNSKYTVSPDAISPDATGAQTITVTANPTSVKDNMDGKITISGKDFADDTEVTLSTTVIRKSPALAFDPTSVSLTRGEAFTAPTFIKDEGISFSSISFTSSYNDVATVSDEGVISLGKSTGTAIIKANFEQTDVYAAGSATCSITVNPAGVTPEPSAGDYYEKVTDVSDLEDGDYLIVYEDGAVALDGNLADDKVDASNNTVAVTFDASNHIEVTGNTRNAEFEIKAITGGFSIKSKANSYYLCHSGSKNSLNTDSKAQVNSIEISSGDATVKNASYYLSFNSTSGQERFRYFSNTNQHIIQLYKKVAGAAPPYIDIYVSAAGYSTYASNFYLDFTTVTDLKAYIAKEDKGIKMVQVNKVPKGAGILLRATDGGDKTYSVPTATTTDDVTGNLFVRGNDEAVVTGNGPYNYILNVVNNQLGFYKANGNTVAKNRAYLQTTVTASRINLNFEDETTGIAEVKTNVKSDLFNINGQRVEKTAKGLYIMNGKKFIVK